MDGLLRHFEAQLAQMTEAERAELTAGTRRMLEGAKLVFPKLSGGKKHMVAALGWMAMQFASERTKEQFRESLQKKATKAGPHVDAIFRTF